MVKQLHCIVHPQESSKYYAIREDGVLALYQNGQREPLKEYPAVEQIRVFDRYDTAKATDESYTMEILWPWLSVFQKYGTNGCVYHLESGEIKLFSRENYHAEVSGFSNGLMEYKGEICLLHQTQWNRLDITNLETGELLTEREIYYRILEETGERGERKYEKKNYVDYFHGRIFFSPDYRYFVDTGWVWQPEGVPVLYCVEDFLTEYENSRIDLAVGEDWIYGDDWDQSAVWLDSDTFLLNFCPDLDFMEDSSSFAEKPGSVLLQFNVCSLLSSPGKTPDKKLEAQKIIPFPFVPTLVQSCYLQRNDQVHCFVKMLNVELYWDEREQLLIGIDGNGLLVFDPLRNASYCIRYGNSKCFYSLLHHMAYQLPQWPGNFIFSGIRELMKAAQAFRII